jgi:hypothetical protein
LPGQAEVPPKFPLIEAKIGDNASECTLEELNTIRKRYCSEVKLSEIVFHLLAYVESNGGGGAPSSAPIDGKKQFSTLFSTYKPGM